MTEQELYRLPSTEALAYFERQVALLRARMILNRIGTRGLDANMPMWAVKKLVNADVYLEGLQEPIVRSVAEARG